MWEQYRKTFVGMQVVIALVTAAMYLLFVRQWQPVGTFYATLQVAALLGAYWGDRLRRRVQGRA